MSSKKRCTGWCIFPGYKWCGPGCSGPDAPINDVDACCMDHDLCLKNGGSFCQCDREFMNCLRPKTSRKNRQGAEAAIMYAYMKMQTKFTCRKRGRKY